MSECIKADHPCWTLESLRVHLQRQLDQMDQHNLERFQAQQRAVDLAINSAREATSKAERATELRFNSVNEFRETLADQVTQFVTRAQFEEAQRGIAESRQTLVDRLERINSYQVKTEGAKEGTKDQTDHSRANLAIVLTILVGLWSIISPLMGPLFGLLAKR